MAAAAKKPGGPVIVRSILWIVIASIFLVRAGLMVMRRHALGFPVGWWLYAQVLIWAGALGFWLWAGWRDLARRDSSAGGNSPGGRGVV